MASSTASGCVLRVPSPLGCVGGQLLWRRMAGGARAAVQGLIGTRATPWSLETDVRDLFGHASDQLRVLEQTHKGVENVACRLQEPAHGSFLAIPIGRA